MAGNINEVNTNIRKEMMEYLIDKVNKMDVSKMTPDTAYHLFSGCSSYASYLISDGRKKME